MSSKLKKIEFKRMLKRYESSLEDLEYLREMASEINSEFNSALAAKRRHDIFESKEMEDISEAVEDDEPKMDGDRDPLFKKLFRKIVVKCHPDRMDKDLSIKQQAEFLEYYDVATNANDDNNMALLITVAIKLDIELSEEYFEHIEKIQEEADKVEKEIEGIQGSIAWSWYHTEEERRDMLLDNYIKHMEKVLMSSIKRKVKILGLGHPRTGTGFTAKLLQSWGLDVGHEEVGKDGIIAWQLAVDKGPWIYLNDFQNNLEPELIIYNVRDPLTSIASIIFTENVKEESINFRIKKGGVIKSTNKIEMAINSILRWDRLITAKQPAFIYRIEDQEKELFDFLKSKDLDISYAPSTGKVNERDHDGLEGLENEKRAVRPSVKRKFNDFCLKYGYKPFFD